MMTFERLAFTYFGALIVLSWARPLTLARRARISAIAATMCAAILVPPWSSNATIRAVAPFPLILIGYYASGLFFVAPTRRFESWLIAWDRRLLDDPTARFAHWPWAMLAYLDIIYMGCFLLVPAGLAAMALAGEWRLLDRYWTMVMGAEFGAFLPLTIVQARPPWAIEREPALRDRAIHRLAARFVREVTIRANTFPSGHAAGSLAVALALIGALPVAGFILLFLALSICLACIVGRYHYVMDVLSGIVLALVIYIAVISFGL